MANKTISAPVGPWEDKKSKNETSDVKTVQELLQRASVALKEPAVHPGQVDGKIAKKASASQTIKAIIRFQRFFTNNPDGRVDPPPGRTFAELLRLDVAAGEPTNWMNTALGERGVKEIAGSRATPSIVMYLSSCKTNQHFTRARQLSDETAWCAAFVNWVLKKSGLSSLDTPWAPSWEKYGHSLPIPLYGAVTVIRRSGGSGRHVAFFVKASASHVTLLGGNQGNRVCEKDYPAADVVAYRWPYPIQIGVPISTPSDVAYA